MKSRQRTLRQQKLWWCAAHNTEMADTRYAPVAFVFSRMPAFIDCFAGNIERAKDALHQYLGSEKPNYWATRPEYVAELCKALSLSRDTWDQPELAVFVDLAERELSAAGVLVAQTMAAARSREAERLRLNRLPIEDGRSELALQREELALGGFRRSSSATNWPHVKMNEPVRVQIQATPGRYVVAFTVDPHGEFCALLPSDGDPPAKSESGVLLIPEASAQPMYPPDKADWHELVVAIGTILPDSRLSQVAFGGPLEISEIGCLVDHCELTAASGGALKRLFFHVAE